MERDTLTLLTVGNIERLSVEELEKRLSLLKSWLRMIQHEMEFVEYVHVEKLSK